MNPEFEKSTIPSRVEPHSATEMRIEWSNQAAFAVPYFELRFYCPCASCVDEHTGRRTLKRESLAADVRPTDVNAIGRYALQFHWSDKHSTGMYPFNHLFSICLEKGLRLA